MDEAKEDKYAMSAYADPIDYFFLKENNHYESECYYAIVKANSDAISNKKYYNVAEITSAKPVKSATDRDSTGRN